ncbi:hypothetical protein [Arthrobacter sp. A5]|uniref:hypothetical protein n=1 Tax=Arthrobacter sp. A5 TaxID=576926 RepID=UPI003DA8D7B1
MTEPPVPVLLPEAGSPAQPASLWKPVLLRALVGLVFGAVTVFWAAPNTAGMGLAIGVYFLASAASLSWLLQHLRLAKTNKNFIALALPAGVLAACGFILFFHASNSFVAWIGAAGLFVLGLGELYLGIKYRGRHLLARDWLTAGIVGIGTAVVLPFFTELGPHALLGVAGGGSIVTGALLLLAGLTIRFDAGKPARP